MVTGLAILLALGAWGGEPSAAPTGAQNLAFTNDAREWALDGPAKRAVFGDLDGDGWLDVILDCERVLLSRPAAPSTLAGQSSPGGKSNAGARRFVDATAASGLDRDPSAPGGKRRSDFLILGDVDGDGDLDIYSGVRLEPECWQEEKDESGERVPAVDASGKRLPRTPDPGFRSAILLNDGAAHFSPLANSGVGEHAESSCAACFLDYDLDGVLDLFVGNWYRSYGWSYDAYPDRLYRGRGDGTFVEVTEEAGLLTRGEAGHADSSRPTYGVTSGDWNGDGWPDLFVCAYGRRWNRLWRNDGDGTFTSVEAETGFDGDAERSGRYPEGVERTAEAPFRANGNTFDCALADFDEDGDLDAFLAEITHAWAGSSSDLSSLLVNLGPAQGFGFGRRPGAGAPRAHTNERWNQGDLHAGWLDADGDGLRELFIASGDYPDDQRLRLLHQLPDHTFADVTVAAGLDWEGCGSPSVGDVDRDGDPDLLVGRSLFRLPAERRQALGARPGLWVNRGGDRAHWLVVRIEGRGRGGCNRGGIGSRVVVRVGGRLLHRELHGGAGHSGHQDAGELRFGLGEHRFAERLEVHWARAKRRPTVLSHLPAGHLITVREAGPGGAVEVDIAPLPGLASRRLHPRR